MPKKIDQYKPHPDFTWSIHLDGDKAMHDKSVCLDGTYEKAVEAIRLAKARGFRVSINCTLFSDADPERVAAFLRQMKATGLDGITVSPGYAYERAPDQEHFLSRERTRNCFARIFARGRGGKAWPFSQSATVPGFPRRQSDLSLHAVGQSRRATSSAGSGPAIYSAKVTPQTFKELMEETDWDSYGVGNYEKCSNCMVHCGFEATAVTDSFRHPLKALGVS